MHKSQAHCTKIRTFKITPKIITSSHFVTFSILKLNFMDDTPFIPIYVIVFD